MSKNSYLIAHNPKPIESYLDMFSLIFEYAEEYEKTIEESVKKEKFDSLEFSSKEEQYLIFKHLIINSFFNDLFNYRNITIKYNYLLLSKNIIEIIRAYLLDNFLLNLLTKNNQIETLIKIFRTSISRNVLLIHYQIPINATAVNLSRTIQASNGLQVSPMLKDNKKLQSLADKIFSRYYNLNDVHNNFKSLYLSRYLITDLQASFTHLKNIIDKNENFKLKYDKMDFKGKSLSEIEDTLKGLEKEIDESKDSSLVYEGGEEKYYLNYLNKEKHITSLFLKVDDTYSWYLIKTDSSDLESFIGSKGSGEGQHCGTASHGENCLLSLRSLNEKGQFILHATCSANSIEADDEKYIYELIEKRGRRNQPIKPDLWTYMYALYADERITTEGEISYHDKQNFTYKWFKDLPEFFKFSDKQKTLYGKMYNEIKNNKPFINNFNLAMLDNCSIKMTKKYAFNIIEVTDFFKFLSSRVIDEVLNFYEIKTSFFISEWLTYDFRRSMIKWIINGEHSEFVVQRLIDQDYIEKDVILDMEKLKKKFKKKKIGKNHLLKVIKEYVKIEKGIIVLTIEDEHTFNHYMDLEGSGLDWYLKVLEDPFDQAEIYIDGIPEMIYPKNHQNESYVNLKEVLEYLKSFEEKTHIQVYSPIEEDYNKTEMILSMDEHFYENIINKRRSLKGEFGDFAENVFEAIMTAYRDTCRLSTESGIQKAILEGIDGIELEGYFSENTICEFSNDNTSGIMDIIFRLDEHNIEHIIENDFELEKLDSELNKRHEIDIFHYGYEFDFDLFTELLDNQLHEKFA